MTGEQLRRIADLYDALVAELEKLKAKYAAQSDAMQRVGAENKALLARIEAINTTDVERLRREHTEMIDRLHKIKKSLTGE